MPSALAKDQTLDDLNCYEAEFS